MRSKPIWRALAALMLEKMCEHDYILRLYINSTLKFIQDRHKPLAKSFKNFFQALLAFIKKIRQGLNNHNIFEEVWKIADMLIGYNIFK